MERVLELCHHLHGTHACHISHVSNCLFTEPVDAPCYTKNDSGFLTPSWPPFQNSDGLHGLLHGLYTDLPNYWQRNDRIQGKRQGLR